MVEKVKVPNYSAETTLKMIEIYQSAGSEISPEGEAARESAMLEIQVLTGKTINSIRAKLGSENVYIAKAKPEPKGKNGMSKSELVAKIQDGEVSKPSGFFDSLESANKLVLSYVLELQGIAQGYAVEFDEMENIPESDDFEPTS